MPWGRRSQWAYLDEIPLLVGDLGNGDLEVSIVGRRAARRNSARWCDLVGDTLGGGKGNSHKGGGDEYRLHLGEVVM